MAKSAKKRKPLSKRVRFEVFKRDSFKCQYCGRSAPDVILQADHIEPVCKGGSDDLLNLVTACEDCNGGKSGRELSDDAVAVKSRTQVAELQERREQIDMMLKWRSGLRNLDNETLEKISNLWSEYAPAYSLNEHGKSQLRKLLRTFSLDEILTAIQTTADQYLSGDVTKDLAERAFAAIGGICRVSREEKINPGSRELYYIRGIFRTRMRNESNYYGEDSKVIEALRRTHRAGVTLPDLKKAALTARNWTHFFVTIDGLGVSS